MTTTQPASHPWNLVTKNLHGHELLREKLREKIHKLETHYRGYHRGTEVFRPATVVVNDLSQPPSAAAAAADFQPGDTNAGNSPDAR